VLIVNERRGIKPLTAPEFAGAIQEGIIDPNPVSSIRNNMDKLSLPSIQEKTRIKEDINTPGFWRDLAAELNRGQDANDLRENSPSLRAITEHLAGHKAISPHANSAEIGELAAITKSVIDDRLLPSNRIEEEVGNKVNRATAINGRLKSEWNSILPEMMGDLRVLGRAEANLNQALDRTPGGIQTRIQSAEILPGFNSEQLRNVAEAVHATIPEVGTLQGFRNFVERPEIQSSFSIPEIAMLQVRAPDILEAVASSAVKGEVGGIDLSAEMMGMIIQRDPNGKPLPISKEIVEKINIDGLTPVILEIGPVDVARLPK